MRLSVGKQRSVLATLWDWVKSLAALAVIGWVSWYAYSLWNPDSSGESNFVQGATFNCRKALAELATDYACRNSDSCTMTRDELIELKNREADIEKYCN